jgi:hypothetical protein
LKQNGPVQGERAQEYVDISSRFDAAMGHFDQIPHLVWKMGGRPNGFHLRLKDAWKACPERLLQAASRRGSLPGAPLSPICSPFGHLEGAGNEFVT